MFSDDRSVLLVGRIDPMSDKPDTPADAFYTPGHVATPRVVPRPSEPLWEAWHEHKRWFSELRYHGEWGVEGVVLREGDLHVTRMFQTR